MTRTTIAVAAAAVAAASLANQAGGHIVVTYPYSRQFAYSTANDVLPDGKVKAFTEYCPYCFDSGGMGVGPDNDVDWVMERGKRLTDPDVLADNGGGDVYPLPFGEIAGNGNYLESDEIAKRHGICGDPASGQEEDSNKYSIASSNFDIYHEYKAGESFHIDVLISTYHYGHMELFICNTDELPQRADSVPTQECFNKHPLDRDPAHGSFSPIDANYTGRYFVDPEDTVPETNIPVMNGWKGWIVRMHYLLPDGLTCEHCVLQVVYRTAHRCRHPGHDEFQGPDPFSTSKYVPNRDGWINNGGSGVCGNPGTKYAEEFWSCTDMSIVGGDADTAPAPEETPEPEPET